MNKKNIKKLLVASCLSLCISNYSFALSPTFDLIETSSDITPTKCCNKTTITTTHKTDTFHWNDFDLAYGETAQFNFNQANSTAINFVNPMAKASTIYGTIQKDPNSQFNGNVMLFNPNGLCFKSSSEIKNLSSFLGSTHAYDGHNDDIINMKSVQGKCDKHWAVNIEGITFTNTENLYFSGNGISGVFKPNCTGTINNPTIIDAGKNIAFKAFGDGKFDISKIGTSENPYIETSAITIDPTLVYVPGNFPNYAALEDYIYLRTGAKEGKLNSKLISNNFDISVNADSSVDSRIQLHANLEANCATSKSGSIYIYANNNTDTDFTIQLKEGCLSVSDKNSTQGDIKLSANNIIIDNKASIDVGTIATNNESSKVFLNFDNLNINENASITSGSLKVSGFKESDNYNLTTSEITNLLDISTLNQIYGKLALGDENYSGIILDDFDIVNFNNNNVSITTSGNVYLSYENINKLDILRSNNVLLQGDLNNLGEVHCHTIALYATTDNLNDTNLNLNNLDINGEYEVKILASDSAQNLNEDFLHKLLPKIELSHSTIILGEEGYTGNIGEGTSTIVDFNGDDVIIATLGDVNIGYTNAKTMTVDFEGQTANTVALRGDFNFLRTIIGKEIILETLSSDLTTIPDMSNANIITTQGALTLNVANNTDALSSTFLNTLIPQTTIANNKLKIGGIAYTGKVGTIDINVDFKNLDVNILTSGDVELKHTNLGSLNIASDEFRAKNINLSGDLSNIYDVYGEDITLQLSNNDIYNPALNLSNVNINGEHDLTIYSAENNQTLSSEFLVNLISKIHLDESIIYLGSSDCMDNLGSGLDIMVLPTEIDEELVVRTTGNVDLYYSPTFTSVSVINNESPTNIANEISLKGDLSLLQTIIGKEVILYAQSDDLTTPPDMSNAQITVTDSTKSFTLTTENVNENMSTAFLSEFFPSTQSQRIFADNIVLGTQNTYNGKIGTALETNPQSATPLDFNGANVSLYTKKRIFMKFQEAGTITIDQLDGSAGETDKITLIAESGQALTLGKIIKNTTCECRSIRLFADPTDISFADITDDYNLETYNLEYQPYQTSIDNPVDISTDFINLLASKTNFIEYEGAIGNYFVGSLNRSNQNHQYFGNIGSGDTSTFNMSKNFTFQPYTNNGNIDLFLSGDTALVNANSESGSVYLNHSGTLNLTEFLISETDVHIPAISANENVSITANKIITSNSPSLVEITGTKSTMISTASQDIELTNYSNSETNIALNQGEANEQSLFVGDTESLTLDTSSTNKITLPTSYNNANLNYLDLRAGFIERADKNIRIDINNSLLSSDGINLILKNGTITVKDNLNGVPTINTIQPEYFGTTESLKISTLNGDMYVYSPIEKESIQYYAQNPYQVFFIEPQSQTTTIESSNNTGAITGGVLGGIAAISTGLSFYNTPSVFAPFLASKNSRKRIIDANSNIQRPEIIESKDAIISAANPIEGIYIIPDKTLLNPLLNKDTTLKEIPVKNEKKSIFKKFKNWLNPFN